MIIDDKIRDQKLQHDINREAAKIWALSSGKINKYGYLTGKEILHPEQSGVIEQAKFTYYRLEKAFEKQIKTIENQVEKQIKRIEEHRKQLVKSNAFLEKKSIPFDKKEASILLDKQKEIFYKLVAERTKEIEKLQNSTNFENLIYYFKGSTRDIHLNISFMLKFF